MIGSESPLTRFAAGSILSVPPDLAVARGPASIVPVLAGPGRAVHVEANRPSSLAEYPRRFPGGAGPGFRS